MLINCNADQVATPVWKKCQRRIVRKKPLVWAQKRPPRNLSTFTVFERTTFRDYGSDFQKYRYEQRRATPNQKLLLSFDFLEPIFKILQEVISVICKGNRNVLQAMINRGNVSQCQTVPCNMCQAKRVNPLHIAAYKVHMDINCLAV